MAERPIVVPIAELGAEDLALAGSKGSTLGELMRAGARVPRGFCVTTVAWDLVALKLRHEITPLLIAVDSCSPKDAERLHGLGAALRDAAKHADLPQSVIDQVGENLATFDGASRFVIRASSTVSDPARHPEGGSRQTFLNVPRSEVLTAIRECWASLYSDSALQHWRRAHISASTVSMAVIVQKMLHPRISGVLFTADPLTGERGHAVINAVWGLGETLLGGAVQPDEYRIRLDSGRCVEQRISRKPVAMVAALDSGIEEIAVGERQAEERLLGDELLRSLSELAVRVESHFDAPQDLDWCLVDGAYHVVESRPIRSMFPVPGPPSEGRVLQAYTSLGHLVDNLEPIAPLSIDVWRRIGPFGELMTAAGGRLYLNVTPFMTSNRGRVLLRNVFGELDPTATDALLQLADHPALREAPSEEPIRDRMVLSTAWRALVESIRLQPAASAQRAHVAAEELLLGWSVAIDKAESGADKLDACHRALEQFMPQLILRHWLPLVSAGWLSLRTLRKLLGGEAAGDIDAVAFTSTSEPAAEMATDLETLVDLAARNSELCEWLQAASERELMGGRMIPQTREFWAAWERFVAKHSDHTANVFDISRPRWGKDPRGLQTTLASMLVESAPNLDYARLASLRLEAARARDRLQRSGRAVSRPLARLLIRNMRAYLGLRPRGMVYLARLISSVRDGFQDIGVMLARRGLITSADDVFWLRDANLVAAVQGKDVRDVVAVHRSRTLRFADLNTPRVIMSDGTVAAG